MGRSDNKVTGGSVGVGSVQEDINDEEHQRLVNEAKLVLLEMDSVAVTVPLRPPTKKMKKRKELDALAPPRAISRRSSSGKRSSQVNNRWVFQWSSHGSVFFLAIRRNQFKKNNSKHFFWRFLPIFSFVKDEVLEGFLIFTTSRKFYVDLNFVVSKKGHTIQRVLFSI